MILLLFDFLVGIWFSGRGAMRVNVRCSHCKRFFTPNPRVKNQWYCGKKACQNARRAKWQRQKMKTDPDYRQNQKQAQKDWRSQNLGYWKRYRSKNTAYCDRNRNLQKVRDAKRRMRHLAKMDALKPKNHLSPGSYFIVSVFADLAKMDASVQKVTLIPNGYP